jgi:cobalt-zinc-cadmium efflux system membrane fusion protein
MKRFATTKYVWLAGVGVLLLVGASVAYFNLPEVRAQVAGWLGDKPKADPGSSRKPLPAKLVTLKNGEFGLKLSKEAMASLKPQPREALLAVHARPLPPQIGTVNYDMEKLFVIRPRFAGAIEEIKQIPDAEYPQGPKKCRSIRWGDRVKQGDSLAVIWSRDLGEKKAALVDAICALKLSKMQYEQQKIAVDKGAYPASWLLATERQVQGDSGALLTAERTLRMWKLAEPEIQVIKDEAKNIIDLKKVRDPENEKNWARVEVTVPKFSDDPKKELVIVEKNTQLGDMVDPGRDTPLFKVADLSRLQIWVHPPEEYLPLLREKLKEGPGALRWDIRFQSESVKSPALKQLAVTQISPSLEPNQHTPMLIGYLDNAEGKYLIGQFITATIYVPPPENTVEIPTDAINHLNGQELVFIENPEAKDEFLIRRIAIVQSFKDVSLVRSQLTAEEKILSKIEESKGRYPISELKPGDRVITRGVVELTSALEELRSTK